MVGSTSTSPYVKVLVKVIVDDNVEDFRLGFRSLQFGSRSE
jgi:hypothetical protein